MTAQRKTYWTAADLLTTDFPPIKWAVDNVIVEGLNLFAGPPKVGKSWAALGVGVAVARGGVAFSSIPVDEGDVLYLALEDTPRRLAERLRKVLAGGPPPDRLSFVTDCPPITDGGIEKISGWLAQHPSARLVVIDVFARVRGRRDPRANAYDADFAAMSTLQSLAGEYNVAILLLHHTRKASADDFLDEVNGSQGLAGAADSIIVLKRTRGSADAELHVTGRDVDEAVYALQFDPNIGVWSMLDGPASDYRLGDTRHRVLAHIRDQGSATAKQLADVLHIKHDTARQTVKRMADAGQLDTDGRGTYFEPGLSPVTPVTASHPESPDRDSRDRCDSSEQGEVIPLHGCPIHPGTPINTSNGKCPKCILGIPGGAA
jgi:hypothetical protein